MLQNSLDGLKIIDEYTNRYYSCTTIIMIASFQWVSLYFNTIIFRLIYLLCKKDYWTILTKNYLGQSEHFFFWNVCEIFFSFWFLSFLISFRIREVLEMIPFTVKSMHSKITLWKATFASLPISTCGRILYSLPNIPFGNIIFKN